MLISESDSESLDLAANIQARHRLFPSVAPGTASLFYYRRYKSNIIYNYSFSVAVYLAEHILNFILNETENQIRSRAGKPPTDFVIHD